MHTLLLISERDEQIKTGFYCEMIFLPGSSFRSVRISFNKAGQVLASGKQSA